MDNNRTRRKRRKKEFNARRPGAVAIHIVLEAIIEEVLDEELEPILLEGLAKMFNRFYPDGNPNRPQELHDIAINLDDETTAFFQKLLEVRYSLAPEEIQQ